MKKFFGHFIPEIIFFVLVTLFVIIVGGGPSDIISIYVWIFLLILLVRFLIFVNTRKSQDQEAVQKAQAKERAVKYNNYMYTCPMCGSHDVKNISTGKKFVTIGAIGAASSNLGKNYRKRSIITRLE